MSDLTTYGLTCQACSQVALSPALWARVFSRMRTTDECILSLNDIYSKTRNVRGTFPLNNMTRQPLRRIAQIADYVCRRTCPLQFAENYAGNRRSTTYRNLVFQSCEIWDFSLPYLEHVVVACAFVSPYQSYDRKNAKLEKVLCALQRMEPSSPMYSARIAFLQSVLETTNDVITKEKSFTVRIISDLTFFEGRAQEGGTKTSSEFSEPFIFHLSNPNPTYHCSKTGTDRGWESVVFWQRIASRRVSEQF